MPHWIAYFGMPITQHVFGSIDLRKKGYRPISLSIHGDASSPVYSAIWVQRPGPPNWKLFHIGSRSQLENYEYIEREGLLSSSHLGHGTINK